MATIKVTYPGKFPLIMSGIRLEGGLLTYEDSNTPVWNQIHPFFLNTSLHQRLLLEKRPLSSKYMDAVLKIRASNYGDVLVEEIKS